MTAPGGEWDSAKAIVADMLRSWGLESLIDQAWGFIEAGDPVEVIPLRLQETREYKERFAANEARRKAGLSVLSPAEYIANEREYRQALRSTGVPEEYWDENRDFQRWLEGDVSPQEVLDRAEIAQTAYINSSQEVRDAWQSLYGLGAGDALAALLYGEVATPVLERRARAATIAAEAMTSVRGGYELTTERAERFAEADVTARQAREAFTDIESRARNEQMLARMSGRQLGREELEDEALLGDQTAAASRRRVLTEERARFSENYLTQQGAFAADRQF